MEAIHAAIAARLGMLHTALAKRAEADLTGVRLSIVPGLPIAGLACGNDIYVSRQVMTQPPEDFLHVVAHELVHVFQQRAGRVPPGACTDPTLEAEAEVAARGFVAGSSLQLHSAGTSVSTLSLQPLLSVGGVPRREAAEFSQKFLRTLQLVPNGPAWLAWALRVASPVFSFADEAVALDGIQSGLTGTPVLVFTSAGLRIAPSIFLRLEDPDFSNVVGSLETGQLTPAAFAALSAWNIRTESDFAQVGTALATLGVAGQPSTHAASLADQVILYETFVAQNQTSGPNALAAAQFAAGLAQNAADFAAAFQFYLAFAAAKQGAQDQINPNVAQAWTALGNSSFGYLNCPQLAPGISTADLLQAVSAYLNRTLHIGFPTLAIGLSAIARHAGLPLGQPLDQPAKIIEDYVFGAGRALRSALGSQLSVNVRQFQDGSTRWLDFTDAGSALRLQCDSAGLVSLLDFTPATPSENT